jgi:NAD(P)-dependent dehydrogenase (short-subunit alcohol dehydrogenase family)
MRQTPAFWSDRRVLVTGCTGFLGTWVVRELLANGANVTGLIRNRVPDSDLIRDRLFEGIRVVRGRIEDGMRLRQTLAIHEIETVFHLAGPPADTPEREATVAQWLDTVRTAMRVSSPAAILVVPVRGTNDDKVTRWQGDKVIESRPSVTVSPRHLVTLSCPADRRPRTVFAHIPSRSSGPDAARVLLATAEWSAITTTSATAPRAAA